MERTGERGETFGGLVPVKFNVPIPLITNSIELKGNYNSDQDLIKQIRKNSIKPDQIDQKKMKILEQLNALFPKLVIGVCDVGVAASLSGYWKTWEGIVGLCIFELWPIARTTNNSKKI